MLHTCYTVGTEDQVEVTTPKDQGSAGEGSAESSPNNDTDSDEHNRIDAADEDADIDDTDDQAVEMIQARAALNLIKTCNNIVPRYMNMCTQRTHLQWCFENAATDADVVSALETVAAVESFSEQWQTFKHTLGAWKGRIIGSLYTGTMVALIARARAKTAAYLNMSKRVTNSRYAGYAKITDGHYDTVLTVLRKNGECVVSAKMIPMSDFDKAIRAYIKEQELTNLTKNRLDGYKLDEVVTDRGRDYMRSVNRRVMRRIHSSNVRIMKWMAIATFVACSAGLLTKNTPHALYKAASLKLPTDSESYDLFGIDVANIITAGTMFSVKFIPSGTTLRAEEGTANGGKVTISTEKLFDHLKDRDDILKRFVKIIELLDKRMAEATASGNPYSVKAVTYLTSVCKTVIDKCSEGGGKLTSILQKLDVFMDQFHEEANEAQK